MINASSQVHRHEFFLRRITQHAHERRVDVDESAVPCRVVDTIGGIFKQLAITCFGSTQRLFDAFAPGDVRDDASDRVYFCPGVKQWKLLNNACVRTILLERDFLEFHFESPEGRWLEMQPPASAEILHRPSDLRFVPG